MIIYCAGNLAGAAGGAIAKRFIILQANRLLSFFDLMTDQSNAIIEFANYKERKDK